MNKREMSEYIRGQASALVRAMDLDQLLGTTVYEQHSDNEEMLKHCEKEQGKIADSILRRPKP